VDFVTFLENMNWHTIITVLAIAWYFSKELRSEMKSQGLRIDKLHEMLVRSIKEDKK